MACPNIYLHIALCTFLISAASSQLLRCRDVLPYLLQEHANGNRGWNFTLEIETQSGAIQLDVVEAASTILPSATYLVHDRPSRQWLLG
jgi:hypothetical protein